jgi:hypothetical protein
VFEDFVKKGLCVRTGKIENGWHVYADHPRIDTLMKSNGWTRKEALEFVERNPLQYRACLETRASTPSSNGRPWRGFHHHATLCIATYGFLISERETIRSSGPGATRRFEELAVSAGSDPATPPLRPERHVDRHHAPTPCSRSNGLSRCPCCQAAITTRSARRNL